MDVRRNAFSQKVIGEWNRLPDEVVLSTVTDAQAEISPPNNALCGPPKEEHDKEYATAEVSLCHRPFDDVTAKVEQIQTNKSTIKMKIMELQRKQDEAEKESNRLRGDIETCTQVCVANEENLEGLQDQLRESNKQQQRKLEGKLFRNTGVQIFVIYQTMLPKKPFADAVVQSLKPFGDLCWWQLWKWKEHRWTEMCSCKLLTRETDCGGGGGGGGGGRLAICAGRLDKVDDKIRFMPKEFSFAANVPVSAKDVRTT
ncbi:unnamed protein product [Dibothriocephalus latus]|uniref:Uncharacterized protein n=1 Tax=Dibothriocephalus latus TaxID=60516 RepID=A0A3P6TGU5_DIBLA|nr:unnamed protein product [Dibothriocephalus latus]